MPQVAEDGVVWAVRAGDVRSVGVRGSILGAAVA